MDDKNIIKQLIEMNSREEILHFLTKNNVVMTNIAELYS